MPNSSTKILVKVGKSSKIKFRGVQTYRAITLDELDTLSKLNPDASIVIIENIKQSEDTKLKQFISAFEAVNNNNKVFFYVADNDDATCGVADELAYDIYLNIKDLYRAIKINCGLTVDVDLSLSPEFNSDSSFDTSFDDSFQDALETIPNEMETKELPTIESKDDLVEFNTSIIDDVKEVEEAPTIELNKNSDETPVSNDIPGEISDAQSKELDELQSKLQSSENEVNQLKKQLHDAFEKSRTLSNLAKALETERDEFKSRLKLYSENTVLEEPISLIDYQELENKVKQLSEQGKVDSETSEKVSELTNLLKIAQEEKEESLRQLEEYKDRLRESGAKLSSAQSKLNDSLSEIETLKNDVDRLKKEAELSTNTSVELQSAKADSIVAQQEIENLNNKIKEDKQFIENIKNEVQRLSTERGSLLDRIEQEVSSRILLMKLLFNSIKEISELSISIKASEETEKSLRETILSLQDIDRANKNKIEELQEQLASFGDVEATISALKADKAELQQTVIEQSSTLADNETKIADLESQVSDVEKRIELAHNFAKQELDTAKREAIEWKTKFDIVQSQFSAKEAQYNTLVQSVGMNENGVNSLLENNRTMDEINRTLRDQIVMLKNDLEKANKDKIFAQQTASALEESNKNMRVSMKAMSVGMSGGVNVSSGVPPFQYQGRGMVIPVFGCGSFGITTTAMSIATKLSAQARVLYIDFDMVAPKADGWFKENPLIRNAPDIEPNNPKATGLGLFVDKQIQYFLNNSAALIAKPVVTKSGCIDYISGFYAKPDAIKLMSADFGSFLNYCGNTYTYVIIDFGRLGSSDINDQIIKAFTDVAYRSVVITTSDKFEIRTFRMKLAEAKIDINNIAWLVNMCERTNLEDTAKKAISPALYSLMPFNSDLYGKKLDFTKDRLTRDKLSLFMEKVLFRK